MADSSCAVCLETLSAAGVLRLRCGHALHAACASEVRRHGATESCPLCRAPLRELWSVERLLEGADLLQGQAGALARDPGGQAEWEALELRALELLREAQAVDPQSEQVQLRMGEAFSRCGMEDEALPLLKAAAESHPESAEAHCLLGMALCGSDELTMGLVALKRAVELAPDHWGSRLAFGACLAEHGDLQEAEVQFRAVQRLNPLDFQAHLFLGASLWKRGDVGGAKPHVLQALRLNPECLDAQAILGRLLSPFPEFDSQHGDVVEATT